MNTIEVKSNREQILLRPEMWFGEMMNIKTETWTWNLKSVEYKTVSYSSGLMKLFDETITNATDVYQKIKSKTIKPIEVEINPSCFSVKNYGLSLSLDKIDVEGKLYYTPEVAFSHLYSSSNYNDSTERLANGQNGVGIKLTNIYSTQFIVEIVHKNQYYKQVFKNNMSEIGKPTIKPISCEDCVKVTVYPDFQRLGIESIDKDNFEYLLFRCYSTLLFKHDIIINKQLIRAITFNEFSQQLIKARTCTKTLDPTLLFTFEAKNLSVVVYVVPIKYHIQVSFVNNIITTNGGNHVRNIVNQIKDEFNVEGKNPCNYMIMVINQTVDKPKFESQAKTKLSTKVNTNIKKLTSELAKCEVLNNMIKQVRHKKEELVIYSKCNPAHKAGTSESMKCSLYITEGDSATAMANKGFSRIGYTYNGIFTLRGKVLNVSKASERKILENEIITNLLRELGLTLGYNYTDKSKLRYGRVIMLKDADVDGDSIMGLVFNLFHSKFNSLIQQNDFFYEFTTPAFQIILKQRINPNIRGVNMSNNVKLEFTSVQKFNEALTKINSKDILRIHYMKGLGSISDNDIQRYFSEIDKHLILLKCEDKTHNETRNIMNNVYSGGKRSIEARKNWVLNRDEDIVLERTLGMESMTVTDFMNKSNIHYAFDSCIRSIPNLYDGLKPCQRKILYTLFSHKSEAYTYQKVTSLSGDVTKFAKYLHGESSLEETIFGMMRFWAGSNNIPLLKSNGTIGSRLDLGLLHSQSRYVMTALDEIARYIFPEADDKVLDYVLEEGETAEPEYYVPIIPLVLINGASGIGTGFSTNIPNHNQYDCINYIRECLKTNESELTIHPYYPNCNVRVEEVDNGYVTFGKQEYIKPLKTSESFWKSTINPNGDKSNPLDYNPCYLKITEVPIGINYTSYIERIKNNIVDNKFKSNDEKCILNRVLNLQNSSVPGSLITNDKVDLVLKLDNPNFDITLDNYVIPMSSLEYTSNMYVVVENKKIAKFDSIYDIMVEFINKRLDLYVKRKNYQMKLMYDNCVQFFNRAKFIKCKVHGIKCYDLDGKLQDKFKLDTRGININTLNKWLELNKFTKFDNGYNYILDFVTTKRETEEEYNNLAAKYQKQYQELQEFKKKDIRDIWLEELDALESKLRECDKDRLDSIAESQRLNC